MTKEVKVTPSEKKDDEQTGVNNNSPFGSKSSIYANVILIYFGLAAISGIGYVFYLNPQIFKIQGDTLVVLNQAVNALVLLSVPFLLGCLGASARILIAGEGMAHHLKVTLSSGLLAMFSWIGVKSKVFLALLAPYVEKVSTEAGTAVEQLEVSSDNTFYSMALVAVLVGMFSSNIYIYINQRVKQLTNT